MIPTDAQKNPWHIESSRTLIENPWFSVIQQQVRNPAGNLSDYFSVDFARPAVGIVARRGGHYLLIYQYRHLVDEYVWAIPSGGVEQDEPLEAAAMRELAEETGYRAAELKHLFGYYPSYGATNQRFEVFLAEDIELSEKPFDPNETIQTGWFTRQDVIGMILGNRIVDGLSLTPLAFVLLEEHVEHCRHPL